MKKTGPGIACPACGKPDGEVIDSRKGPGYIRRRRECRGCRKRHSTIEVVAGDIVRPKEDPVVRALELDTLLVGMGEHRRGLVMEMIRLLGGKT